MNILYLCDEYPPGRHGGIGTAVQLLAREMVKKGHNVIVAGIYHWGYGESDSFVDEGVKVFRFRMKLASKEFAKANFLMRATTRALRDMRILQWDVRSSLRKYGQYLEALIKEYSIEIVEMPDYNDYMRFCKGVVSFPTLSVPVIVKMHGCMTYIANENGSYVPPYVQMMEEQILKQATAVVSVSKYNATRTAGYLHYDGDVKVLYNGISMPPAERMAKEQNKVVYTGTLSFNKGVFQLVQAWNEVHKAKPDARLYLFGKGPLEKITPLLTAGALPTVLFKGHVAKRELYENLASATMAVFPSYAESFAMAPMEAMACGTAVIYTSRTSGPELIKDGHDGLLVDPADIKDIAAKILYLFEHKSKADELAANGKKKIVELYNISTIADNNLEYYTDIISGFKPPSKK